MADIDQLETTFDEDWYLLTYPDVAEAVARGGWKSGFDHYEKVGRERGRFASAADKARRPEAAKERPASSAGDNPPTPASAASDEFDARFYAEAYPLAREEVADRVAADFTDHYVRFGRHRGYLPNKTAPRLENPAKWMSRFGGFWTDQANAMDLVAGKLDLGFINGRQANLLRRFIQDGYVVIEHAVPDDVLAAAEAAVDRAYNGGFPDAKYNVDGVGHLL
jgi:hypothetical protein